MPVVLALSTLYIIIKSGMSPSSQMKHYSKCSIYFWIMVISQTKLSAINLDLLAVRDDENKWNLSLSTIRLLLPLPYKIKQIIDKTQYLWTHFSLWWKGVAVHMPLVRDDRDWWEVSNHTISIKISISSHLYFIGDINRKISAFLQNMRKNFFSNCVRISLFWSTSGLNKINPGKHS